MPANKALLLTKLQNLVATDYVLGSTSATEIVSIALGLQQFSETNIIVVSNVDALPNLVYYTSPSGMIYYVDDIGVFALSSNSKWITLDGRLLRQDTIYSTVWAWGANFTGRLGDNTTVSKLSPVLVVGGFTDWCQVSAGRYHSVGIRTNGTAWAWGINTSGTLGDNTVVTKSSPVSVVGGFTDWCQISSGRYFNAGIRSNGTAWAWGINQTSQLGDCTTVAKSSPVSVVGGFTDWCQVSAGCAHVLGLRSNGTAWAWGCNTSGQLGDCTTVAKSSPVSVVGGFTDWCQVSAGGMHSLGVRLNGTVWTWGCNTQGRLGDNTTTNKSSPVSVVGGFTDWCQVSAGFCHSIALRTNGTAWAWGSNVYGTLGNSTIVSTSSPVSVAGGFTDWCRVSGGHVHSLGVRTNGTAWAWGGNSNGQLGNSAIVSTSSPVSVAGGFTDWCQVSAGYCHNLGIKSRC